MRQFFYFISEIIKVVILSLVVVLPIRYFLFQPFLVKGQSMEPNFHERDYLIIDQISYRFRDPKRGEVIVFKSPHSPSHKYIKRIIGLPGETVEIKDGKIRISGVNLNESEYLPDFVFTDNKGFEKITLGENEYFVLGDNRVLSSDSRVWGPLSREKIVGRVFVRLWPFSALAKVELPNYYKE